MLLLALGGFVGNFVFSLTDHAQNGFFNPLEWIPVVSSALAVGFLLVPFVVRSHDAVPVAVRGGASRAGAVGVAGFALARGRGLRQPGADAVRASAERRAADGAAAVSEPRAARVDRAVDLGASSQEQPFRCLNRVESTVAATRPVRKPVSPHG